MDTSAHSRDDEKPLDEHGLAAITLTLNWSDDRAAHEEQQHVEKFSVWREADILPPEIGPKITGMRAGDSAQAEISPGGMIGAWATSRQISTHPSRFDRHHRRGLVVEPRLGRFYPQGFFQGVSGVFSEAVAPARITGLTRKRLDIDTNHPLARFPLQVQLHLDRVLPGYDRRGGRCISPLDDLLRHPGLSAPLPNGQPTDYGDDTSGLSRMDDRSDAAFYARPRRINHMDDRALEGVNTLYRRLIPAQAVVLDLMASFDSHLQGLAPSELHVLGMNAEELAANQATHHRVVQDLNESPILPYENSSIDAVVCTASIEYLVRPAEVLAETLRILRPGGVFVATFSNRWFPSKAIRIWSELHEYERVGMVTQWLQQQNFVDLHTFSSHGWPRPADDPHGDKTPYSDPVFAVWGSKADD